MDINKEELKKKFQQQDWNYVFDKARVISEFLLIQKFRIYDEAKRQDMVQECLENFYKKILKGKVNPQQNIFAFIWSNSRYRILEMLRKERNRNRIATFSPYDDLDENNYSSYIDFDAEVGDKYVKAIGE
jgi:DNA-directed RNA polymerase specialized sigma24 family protein